MGVTTFYDNFTSTTLGSKWYQAPGNNLVMLNPGLRMVNPTVTSHNGITALNPDGTQFTQLYGKFYASCTLFRGAGVWPGFWLMVPPIQFTPNAPEIDVFENHGQNTNLLYLTVHWPPLSYNQSQVQYVGPDFSIGRHTFMVEWRPTFINWWVDGVQVRSFTNQAEIPQVPLGVHFTVNMGGWAGSVDPAALPAHVDVSSIWVTP